MAEMTALSAEDHTEGTVTALHRVTELMDRLDHRASGRRGTGQFSTPYYSDLVSRVFDVYDDDTWVYPGHGSDTTLGAERPHLRAWRDRGW